MQKQQIFILLCLLVFVSGQNWGDVTSALQYNIDQKLTPGLVAAVIGETGTLYLASLGNFTYGVPPPANNDINPPMSIDTIFDMASLTKVTMSTTVAMQFYQRGELDLDTKVSDPKLLGPNFSQQGKENITVRNLLLHNAGYPPDPVPNYNLITFPCPENKEYYPAEIFVCQKQVYAALMNQTLRNPVGAKYVYSDLSMITMMYVVGHLAQTLNKVSHSDLLPACAAHLSPNDPEIAQCYYEAYIRKYIFSVIGMPDSGFLPPQSKWNRIAPTWFDPEYRHIQLQGQVSDENAYVLGGISGHAGLFTTVLDTMKLTAALMFATEDSSFVNKTTVKYFTTIYNVTQSSRALGWDTNNYIMNTYRGCGNLSSTTWTHTGFTGTEICGDPERKIVTILLTNSCYPTKEIFSTRPIRQMFNNAVKEAFDKMEKNKDKNYPYTNNISVGTK